MKILLDSNAFIWLIKRSNKLGQKAHQQISGADSVYVSAITIFEINIKSMLGKLHVPDNVSEAVGESGAILMDVTASHAEAIKKFPELTKHDPFDRMLLAQAYTEGFTLLTADTILLGLGLPYVLDVRE